MENRPTKWQELQLQKLKSQYHAMEFGMFMIERDYEMETDELKRESLKDKWYKLSAEKGRLNAEIYYSEKALGMHFMN